MEIKVIEHSNHEGIVLFGHFHREPNTMWVRHDQQDGVNIDGYVIMFMSAQV